MSRVDQAVDQVTYELQRFACTISEAEREDFFHPMNRDAWVREFCEWLAAKQLESAKVRPSND